MSKIAQLYETDLKTLHELNPGVALDYVRPKQTIVVPKLRAVATAGAAKGMDVPGICPPKGMSLDLRFKRTALVRSLELLKAIV